MFKTLVLLTTLILPIIGYSQDRNKIEQMLTDEQLTSAIYDSIIESTYYEDDGYERLIPKDNFEFKLQSIQKKTFVVLATGSGHSAWDDKVIGYECFVVLARSEFPTVKSSNCTLSNENWPND